jgi:hypothetical protein
MRPRFLLLVVPALSMIAVGLSAATDREPVPLYTGEDLDRMFGPAPAGPSELVDKARPEDWRWVEQFLDRQYARIDADRQYDLSSREVAVDERLVEHPTRTYGSLLWGGGYPAVWWNGSGARDFGPVHRGDRTPTVTSRLAYDRAMGAGVSRGGMHRGGSRGGGHRSK